MTCTHHQKPAAGRCVWRTLLFPLPSVAFSSMLHWHPLLIILSNKLFTPSAVVKKYSSVKDCRTNSCFSHDGTDVTRGNWRDVTLQKWLRDWKIMSLLLNVWAKTWSWKFRAWIRSRVEAFLPRVHVFFFPDACPRPHCTALEYSPQPRPQNMEELPVLIPDRCANSGYTHTIHLYQPICHCVPPLAKQYKPQCNLLTKMDNNRCHTMGKNHSI